MVKYWLKIFVAYIVTTFGPNKIPKRERKLALARYVDAS